MQDTSVLNGRKLNRVVVTGLGLISPVGIGTEASWHALLRSQSGVDRITLFDASQFACRIAAEVKDFDPERFIDKKDVKKTSRFIQLALAATDLALESAHLKVSQHDPQRIGVYIGSGIGGFEVIEREHIKLRERGPDRVSPFFITATIINLAAAQVAIRSGARGPNLASATACSTGAHAIGEAFRIIQHGDAEIMICGGAEAVITPLSVAGFSSMRALSTRNAEPQLASRPWDIERDGFVIGEGAGILILESRQTALRRGIPILAELIGYARNSEAHHPAAPSEEGHAIRRVMELALADGEIDARQIGYLNAHATSTPLGDRAEANAIKNLFGELAVTLAVSSTKSMTGHMLGAAGSFEAGVSVLALRDQIVPPTINLHRTDQDYGLNFVPHCARRLSFEHALTNSFGFGGTNACLIFRRAA